MHPDHALPDELRPAFELIFQHLAANERRWRTTQALELVARGQLDARGVFVARGGGGVAGALLCSTVEGGGSLIWPPGLAPHLREGGEVGDALVVAACAWLRGRGVRLTQALLPREEVPLAAPMLRNGFRHVTGLSYLRHDLFLPAPLLSAPSRLRFEPYRADRPDEFHHTLLLTYDGTLDCPEVNGVRGIDEVIRGHKAQGTFDPARWWLARLGGDAAGVLLMMEQPDSGDWEVAYMGIVPDFRRRGLGREMLLHALCEARAGGATRATLTVDDRNAPACTLYQAMGFQRYDHRAVILAVWQ